MRKFKEGEKVVDAYGYVMIKVGTKIIPEHRHVMQKSLDRKLKQTEIVHHIDGNKENNCIENLVITNRAEHAKIHFKESIPRQKDWKDRIMHIGHKSQIKIQKPMPKIIKPRGKYNQLQKPRPGYAIEGDIWHHHKMRKAWIVRKCFDCKILFWGRTDYKPEKPICLKCSARRANKLRWR